MKSKEKPIFGTLWVQHEGGILCDFSEKWPDLVIKLPFLILVGELSYFTITIYGNKGECALEEFFRMAKSHPDVVFAKTLETHSNGGSVLVGKKSYGVLKSLYETHSILRGPVTVRRGTKYFPVVTFSLSNVKELEKKARKLAPVKTNAWFKIETEKKRISYEVYPTTQTILSTLSEAEKRVLTAAYELGYFKWPRVHDSAEISEYLGISRTTFLEHLRKAEEKIMKFLYDQLKL